MAKNCDEYTDNIILGWYFKVIILKHLLYGILGEQSLRWKPNDFSICHYIDFYSYAYWALDQTQ